ncbi:MAG TPA: CPBP family intramembrane glutamic endopeptidase [Gemmatimonadales bacterium]|nr:CPBP family intramembrane glutamic endopeptidase [Gemmatimonadales bacterium]
MPAPIATTYWKASKAPRYSLLFAFPLLLVYELLAFVLTHDAISGVRNGADVLLKSLFIALGGRNGVVVFGVILVGTGLVLIWRDMRRSGGDLRPGWFGWMMLESVVYALLFGLIAASLTSLLLHGRLWFLLQVPMERLDLATQLMVSLGAGIYEELLFRVILVGALFKAGKLLGWKPATAGVVATIVGAFIFSAFHYVGPYGDKLELTSFAFRTIAGILFSGLYLLRGFGVTAWTHALYDVFLSLR